MTGDQVAAIVMEMHTASFAIAEHVAVCALSFSCPFPIAIFFEAVVPDINKAVFVDISLMEVGTDARTAGYRSVDQYRCRADTSIAVKNLVAYFPLVIAEETFTGKTSMYLSLGAAMTDEFKDPSELCVVDLQFRCLCRPAHRKMVKIRQFLTPSSIRKSLNSIRSLKFF